MLNKKGGAHAPLPLGESGGSKRKEAPNEGPRGSAGRRLDALRARGAEPLSFLRQGWKPEGPRPPRFGSALARGGLGSRQPGPGDAGATLSAERD